ncbi:hypothetical protein K4L92_00140, partial [Pseudomonas syringae pv. tomato]
KSHEDSGGQLTRDRYHAALQGHEAALKTLISCTLRRSIAMTNMRTLSVAACNRKQPCSQSAQFSAQINCD